MAMITDLWAREILDSRGNPTIEVEVELEDGTIGRAAVPSGASTGEHEAVELRDGDQGPLSGQGRPERGRECERCLGRAGDRLRCAGPDWHRQDDDRAGRHAQQGKAGANAILGVSLATAKAAAQSLGCRCTGTSGGRTRKSCPCPWIEHPERRESIADNNVDFQEFMVMPVDAPTFAEALGWESRCSIR